MTITEQKNGAQRTPLATGNDPVLTPVDGDAGLPTAACRSTQCEHFVQFYERDDFLVESVADFVGIGLAAGEAAVVIATPEHRSSLTAVLAARGFNLAAIISRGQLVVLDSAETLAKFMVDDLPEASAFKAAIGEVIERTTHGRRGLRLFGEMVAQLWADGKTGAAVRLEQFWNDLASEHTFTLFCAYPMHSLRGEANIEAFQQVCREHSRVVPGESFPGAHAVEDARSRTVAALQQKALSLEAEVAERKHLQQTVAQRAREATVLYEFTDRLHRSTSMQEVYNAALDAVLGALPCDRAAILLFDRSNVMRFVAWRGLSESYRHAVEGHSPWNRDDSEPMPVCIRDAAAAELPPGLQPVLESEGIAALAFIPVVLNGRLMGKVMAYCNSPHEFSPEEVGLGLTLARQLGFAVEQKRAEAALRESLAELKKGDVAKNRLAAIVESSDDAIVSKDLTGIITSWNKGAQQLFGYKPEEVIGKPVTILMPPDRVDEEPGILARLARGERIDHYETVRRHKDGTLINISLTISPVRDSDGKIIGASKIARDITDKIRAKEKLEQLVAERTAQLQETVAELEAFSYSIAHDMRAPLRSMNSYARLLHEDYAETLPADAKHYLKRISAGATRLDALITDVLNYSRIARSEMPLQEIDVEKLTREIIDSYPELHDSTATIMVQSPIPPVIANAAALTQALSNLLSNAVKFVAPNTAAQVRVRAEKRGDFIRVWVEDNGIGISPEGQRRIFHMFQRLNPAKEFAGTGIGLTIVRKAVERMGGRVGVESEPGKGSRFWIELKRAA